MAITKYSKGPKRNLIGIFHSLPVDAVIRLEAMGYICKLIDDSYFEKYENLTLIDSVILIQDQNKPNDIKIYLKKYANKLLNSGCQVYVIPEPVITGEKTEVSRRKLIRALNDHHLPPSQLGDNYYALIDDWYEGQSPSPLAPFVHVIDKPNDWDDIARTIRNNPPDTPPDLDLIITTPINSTDMQLSEEDELLIRRAFHGCYTVHFSQISNGLSEGVKTFRAYAHIRNSTTGSQHPYLYFAKIGPRKIISTEYRKYQDQALLFIPFHLGPRLILDRCSLGQSQGILVCDYVQGAEPLRDCAKDGRAAPAISNLFNSTISPWHRNAISSTCSLKTYLDKIFPKSIPDHRLDRIEKYGTIKSPIELNKLLVDKDELVLLGTIHGDLHATNVLVRANDAIIIDFEKLEESFPLLYDAASVEAGLLVDGFIRDTRSPSLLFQSIACLYTADAFNESYPICKTGDDSEWFFNCVRQIRMHAKELELALLQYARTLAVVMVKKGSKDRDFVKECNDINEGKRREDIRALTYVLGMNLLEWLAGDSRLQNESK